MTQQHTIVLESRADRWRFTCPAGHRSWEPTNNHFWCKQCASAHDPDAEPEFSALLDRRTDELVEREQITLALETPPVPEVV